MSNELTLAITRAFAAPRPDVFDAFSGAARLAEWWGPQGFTVPALDFEPLVGARFRIQMQPPDSDGFYLVGEFREVDPPERLAYTFMWEPADPDDVETLVELALWDRGDTTEVLLKQGPFKTEARLALHRGGWTQSLDRLERHLAR